MKNILVKFVCFVTILFVLSSVLLIFVYAKHEETDYEYDIEKEVPSYKVSFYYKDGTDYDTICDNPIFSGGTRNLNKNIIYGGTMLGTKEECEAIINSHLPKEISTYELEFQNIVKYPEYNRIVIKTKTKDINKAYRELLSSLNLDENNITTRHIFNKKIIVNLSKSTLTNHQKNTLLNQIKYDASKRAIISTKYQYISVKDYIKRHPALILFLVGIGIIALIGFIFRNATSESEEELWGLS